MRLPVLLLAAVLSPVPPSPSYAAQELSALVLAHRLPAYRTACKTLHLLRVLSAIFTIHKFLLLDLFDQRSIL